MSSPAKRWRAPVVGAAAGLLAAAAFVGQSALASGGGATPPRPAAKAATASGTAAPAGTNCDAPAQGAGAKAAPGPGPDPAPFFAAVAQLVQAGTINQGQADILDAGIRAGSIDDSQLVANGTLSAAQMQAVDDRLKAVKESLAPAADQTAGANADHSKVARATAARKKLQR